MKVLKHIFGILYGFGVLLVIMYSTMYLSFSDRVLNPHAMIPFTVHDVGETALMLGFIPMTIATILFQLVFKPGETAHKVRNTVLIWIPSAICALDFLIEISKLHH